jgi:glycosyltransferase involved in cell wall biosynthesis
MFKESKKHLLFISPVDSTFTSIDEEILKEKFILHKLIVNFQQKKVRNFVRLILFLLKYSFRSIGCFIWFNDTHAFFPLLFFKLLSKKSFIVIGGYDIANLPELYYGALRKPFGKFLFRINSMLATKVFAVSKFIEKETIKVNKSIKINMIVTIYNGIKIEDYNKVPEKEDIILTVAYIDSFKRFYLKGIDKFLKLASELKDLQFIVIGIGPEFLKKVKEIPKNVRVLPPMNKKDIDFYYRKSKIYCQFSLIESFGISVIEAMSYGCIPIVSNRGALPEIINSKGIILEKNEVHVIKEKVKEILLNYNTYDIIQIIHYSRKFDKKHRKEQLIKNIFS